ncbi:MAG: GNVR domain-containing protein, partial [Flavobacteriaceae bacterium]
MNEDIEIQEAHTTFDLKGFLIRLLSYWPLFLICLSIAFGIAYFINVRKLPIYQIENLVSIKDDQNPFFTSNTSLTFNWGGTTDKVNTAVITLKSRSHNEKVVERLQYYLDYQRQGKYQLVDAYKQTPFFVKVDTTQPQLLWQPIEVVFKDSLSFDLKIVFEESKGYPLQYYNASKERVGKYFEARDFSQTFQLGEKISLPFFSGTFYANKEIAIVPGKSYYFNFLNFDAAVKRYLTIGVQPESTGSSILKLKLLGNNKAKLVDYLNASVAVLSENMLERKNLFATKTIKFIDSSLAQKSGELLDVENELNDFKNKNAIIDIDLEGREVNDKLNNLDVRKEAINRELNYYNTLENYLVNRSDYRDVPAPSVAGISENSIVSGVAQIVAKAQERNKLQYSYKEEAPIFKDIDRQINAIKTVLLENINSTKGLKNQELRSVNNDIAKNEALIRKLPKDQQELLKIERRYKLSQSTYNLFLAKRSEAGLVKAANVSDVLVIDMAKDTGGGKVGPNTKLNYIMAALFGLLIPFLFVFLKTFFDNRIQTVKDIDRFSKIPILGVIGKSQMVSNLAVIEKPKSAIAEAFRALRSSLQYIYKKQGIKG